MRASMLREKAPHKPSSAGILGSGPRLPLPQDLPAQGFHFAAGAWSESAFLTFLKPFLRKGFQEAAPFPLPDTAVSVLGAAWPSSEI